MNQEKAVTELTKKTSKKTMTELEENTSDTPIKEPEKKPNEVKYIGHIERVEGGQVIGWITNSDKDSQENPVNLQILCNGQMVGHGVANKFRQDLKDAGFSNGECAFEIDTNDLDSLITKDAIYTLLDDTSGEIIKGIELKTQLPANFFAHIDRIEHGQLKANIHSRYSIGEKTFVLSVDGLVISEQEVHCDNNQLSMHFPIPSKYQDGNAHLYQITVKGLTTVLGAQKLKCVPIQTPWQYLKDSHDKPGMSLLSEQADGRYESLRYHLKASPSVNEPSYIENISKVHD
jgi:hypothetical protein